MVAFSDKDQLHNGGGVGGYGTGNQTGPGFDPQGQSIEESEAGLLISQMAALSGITTVTIELTINGTSYPAIEADETTTTAVLPEINPGDKVSGKATINVMDGEPRVAYLDETEATLHGVLKFKVPYKYEAYNLGGMKVAEGTYYARDGINLDSCTDANIGGWKCNLDGVVHYGSYVTGVRGDIRLDAVLQAGAGTYSITYVSAAQPVAGETYNVTAAHTLPTPTKVGLAFAGWYEDTAFSISAGTEIPVGSTGNKTFYAKWTATVTFNNNGGSGSVASQTVNYGEFATEPAAADNPTRIGCNFIDWRTSSNGGTTLNATAYSFSTPVTENLTLYVNWEYSVTYISTPQSVAAGTYTAITGLTLPSPIKAGLTFEGWYDNASFTGSRITSISAGTTGNKTYYAKWTATVSFDKKGGSGSVTSQPVNYGESATEPVAADNPTKSGYEFKGWYTSSDGGTTLSATAYSFSTAVTQNITLYAKWDEYTNFVGTATEFAAALFKTGSSLVTPYNVTITDASNSNLSSIAATVASKGVYVNLILQSSGGNLTYINYFNYSKSGAVTYLISLVIPEGVTEIAYQAFQDSSNTNNLQSVTIPASLTKINGQAFTSCDNLTTVIVNGTNNWKKHETLSGVEQETVIGALNATNIKETHSTEYKLRITN